MPISRRASHPRGCIALARRACLPLLVINVTLPGGLVWPCALRLSARARKSLLRVDAHGKTELVLPQGPGKCKAPGSAAAKAAQQAAQDAALKSAPHILQGMLPWLHKTLNRLFSPARQQELAHSLSREWAGQAVQDCLPQAVILPLVGELWHVYVRLSQSPGPCPTALPSADSPPDEGPSSPQGRLRLTQRLLVPGRVETKTEGRHDQTPDCVTDCQTKKHSDCHENYHADNFCDGHSDGYDDSFCDKKILPCVEAAGKDRSVQEIQALSQSGEHCPSGHMALPGTLRALGGGLVHGAQGQLIVSGPVEDSLAACLLLQKWLRKRAARPLEVLLRHLAAGMGAEVRRVQVRSQRGRWGSCSSRGDISLNCRLLLLPRHLVEHVMLHELCHLRHMDHSPQYRRHLAMYAPLWKEREKALHEAWKCLPAWSML